MDLFFAYGNSDQQSFRDPLVRDALDCMTVPGTIAAFYADATAAFVQSSKLKYIIDPRTPLFQEHHLGAPKKSHASLAKRCGRALTDRLSAGGQYPDFPSAFYTPSVIENMTKSLVSFQEEYGQTRSTKYDKALDKYRRLLTLSGGTPSAAFDQARPPSFILAPYFSVVGAGDAWWDINEGIWKVCSSLENSRDISPVFAVEGVDGLAEILRSYSYDLSSTTFFWINDLQEQRAPTEALSALWRTVSEYADQYSLINLYGSYFSVCMSYVGLAGVNSGLLYSESRDWIVLSTTGAPPPRYYVPNLHTFLQPGQASLLVESEPWFACPCSICTNGSGSVLDLEYGQLKSHFALCRRMEVDFVSSHSQQEAVDQMEEAADRYQAAVTRALPSTMPPAGFLRAWSNIVAG